MFQWFFYWDKRNAIINSVETNKLALAWVGASVLRFNMTILDSTLEVIALYFIAKYVLMFSFYRLYVNTPGSTAQRVWLPTNAIINIHAVNVYKERLRDDILRYAHEGVLLYNYVFLSFIYYQVNSKSPSKFSARYDQCAAKILIRFIAQ